MKRNKPSANKIHIPDAINQSVTKEFTQVPNDLLRNPKVTAKAKTVLSILLSNKEGWTTYFTTLQRMMKEGETAISKAIKELQNGGYLVKVRYRDKQTKRVRGSFWAYTDIPHRFSSMKDTLEILDQNEAEIMSRDFDLGQEENHPGGNPGDGNPVDGNPGLKIYNNNNNNNNKRLISSSEAEEDNGKIKPSHFEEFWNLYPRKDSKGAAKQVWEKQCRKKLKDRPNWSDIKQAVISQKESERWQEKQYIPLPTTWLNQERWLDDPANMVAFNQSKSKIKQSVRSPEGKEYPC